MNTTSSNPAKAQVVTSVERRRRYTADQKIEILNESRLPGMNISIVARKYGIAPSQVFYWRRRMEEGAKVGVGYEESVHPASQIRELEKRVARLERMLGRKTEEVEILKEAVRIAREKKLISRQPLSGLEDFE